ncbi:MAG: formate dehydrogenase accessory sulfurtransferase FdhD [Dehalococcoidales bacterium]
MSITANGLAGVEKGEQTHYSQYVNGEWKRISNSLPQEMMITLFINDQELVSIMCTPEKLNFLVTGYLLSEGFINNLDEVTLMRVCLEESLAEVRLTHQIDAVPTRRILTSGCGGGTTYDQGENIQPLDSSWRVSPSQIMSSIKLLQRRPEGNGESGSIRRGLHVSALSDGDKLIIRAEDIGRHNTLDKIRGEAMLTGIPTKDLLLVTTGRISSEMLVKVAKMGIPVVASLNSATKRAVTLGAELGITIVGYARGSRFSVYCCENRLLPD